MTETSLAPSTTSTTQVPHSNDCVDRAMWENERKQLIEEINSLKRSITTKQTDCVREVLSALPMAGVSWFESGCILISSSSVLKTSSSSNSAIKITTNFSPKAREIQGKHVNCWIVSSSSPSGSDFIKISTQFISFDNNTNTVSFEISKANPVWNDSRATIEWFAFAFPQSCSTINPIIQLIETRSYQDNVLIQIISNLFTTNHQITINSEGFHGRTFLHAACSSGNLNLVKWLVIEQKAKIQCQDYDLFTPLHCCCFVGNLQIAKFLLETSSSNGDNIVNMKLKTGATAFHLLMGCPYIETEDEKENPLLEEVITLLLNYNNNNNIDEQRIDGMTGLMLASRRGALRRMEILLKKGADVNKKNSFGETCIHFVSQLRNPNLIHLLASYGADEKMKDSKGKNAIDIVNESTHDQNVLKAIQSMEVKINETSEYVLSYILMFLSPNDLCNSRCVNKLFYKAGSIALHSDDYWKSQKISKKLFIEDRKMEIQFGSNMKEWLAPISMHLPPESMAIRPIDALLKISLFGAKCVGKTSFIHRIVEKEVLINPILTIGMDFKTFMRQNYGKNIKIQLWEYEPSPFVYNMNHILYRGAIGYFILYDITNKKSLVEAERFLKLVEENSSNEIIFLIGTKNDLEKERVVSFQEAEAIRTKRVKYHITVSSHSGHHIELAMKAMTELCLQLKQEREQLEQKTQANQVQQQTKECSLM